MKFFKPKFKFANYNLGTTIVLFCFFFACGSEVNFSSGRTDWAGNNINPEEMLIEKKVATGSVSQKKSTTVPPPMYIKPYVKSPLTAKNSAASLVANDLKVGKQLLGLFRYSQLAKQTSKNFITMQVKVPTNPEIEVLGDEFTAEITISEPVTIDKLTALIKSDPAILALDLAALVSTTELDTADSVNPLDAMSLLDHTDDVKAFYKKTSLQSGKTNKSVRVGIIDTGLSHKLPEFSSVFKDDRLTNVLHGSDDPTDIQGHGTQIASIIGSKTFGIATDAVELIPLLVSETSEIKLETLTRAIIVGTNLGVEVMNISLSGETNGCSPIVGHLIYRAIEKGVFFSFSSGNGIKVAPETRVGYPLVAASDDGPLNSRKTQMPSCWGKYFLGAITTGAVTVKDNHPKMPLFSNYGADVELLAPGIDVPVINKSGSHTTITGTSAAAAITSSAAALAIFHHKVHGLSYTPWYIENLLVQSSLIHEDLVGVERKSRFGGVLNLKRLGVLLEKTAVMREEDRKNIPTINPRFNAGWKPGSESNLKKLNLIAPSGGIQPGSSMQFESVIFYHHNKFEQRVTLNQNTDWSISIKDSALLSRLSEGSKPYLEIDAKGILKLDKIKLENLRILLSSDSKKLIQKLELEVVGAYAENQHLVYEIFPLTVYFDQFEIASFRIEKQPGIFKVGLPNYTIQAFATTRSTPPETINVTGSTDWFSNKPKELVATRAPGVFSTIDARAGAEYTVFAAFKNFEEQIVLKIGDVKYKEFLIHSSLGENGDISIGQSATFYSIAVLDNQNQPIIANWFLDGVEVAKDNSQFKLNTAKMETGPSKGSPISIGNHELKAVAVVKLADKDLNVTKTFKFKAVDTVSRIEVLVKDSIVREGGEVLLTARAYYNNSSYATVSDGVVWSASDNAINIQQSGKATVRAGSAGKAVTVTAKYKGKRHSQVINIVSGSSVTGSESPLVDLIVEKNGKVTGVYADGKTRDVSASTSVSKYFEEGASGKPEDRRSFVKTSYAYNDGSVASGGGGHLIFSKIVEKIIGSSRRPYRKESPSLVLDRDKFLYLKNVGIPMVAKWVGGRTLFDDGKISVHSEGRNSTNKFNSQASYVGFTTPAVPAWKVTYLDSVVKFPHDLKEVKVEFVPPLSIETDERRLIVSWSITDSHQKSTYSKEFKILTTNYLDPLTDVSFNPYQIEHSNVRKIQIGSLPTYIPSFSIYNWHQNAKGFDYSISNLDPALGLDKDFYKLYYSSVNFPDNVELTSSGSGNIHQGITLTRSRTPMYTTTRICVEPQGQDFDWSLKFQEKSLNKLVTGKHEFEHVNNIDFQHLQDKSNLAETVKRSYSAMALPSGQRPSKKVSTCNTSEDANQPLEYGNRNNPHLICTAAEFNATVGGTAAYLKLRNNLDFKGAKLTKKDIYGIDGDGFEIANFVIIDSEADDVGLFGVNTEIINLTIRNATIKGRDFVGAACGHCLAANNVKILDSKIIGRSYVGSFGGKFHSETTLRKKFLNWNWNNENIVVLNSRVEASGEAAGGVFGEFLVGVLNKVYFDGSVTHTGAPGSGNNFGGITGLANGATMMNVVNKGSVSSAGLNVGGIAGSARADIIYAQNHGKVFNLGGIVGGIVGYSGSKIYGTTNFGEVWGGVLSSGSSCPTGYDNVLGANGLRSCASTQSENVEGEASLVGGIAGHFVGNHQFDNNISNGAIRGIDIVGGLIGHLQLPLVASNSYRFNQFSGTADASSIDFNVGGLFGRVSRDTVGTRCLRPEHFAIILPKVLANNQFTKKGRVTKAVGQVRDQRAENVLFKNVDLDKLSDF